MTRIFYAGLAATLALCLSAGTAAYAAERLGKNVVKSRNIAPKAVKSSDIKPGAVNGSHVDESSLGLVPSAQSAVTAGSVNGVREQLVRGAVPNPTPQGTPLTTVDGLVVEFGCDAISAIVVLRGSLPTDQGMVSFIKPNLTVQHEEFTSTTPFVWDVNGIAAFTATLIRADGRVVRFDFQARYQPEAFGNGNDCFLAGFTRSAA